MTKVSSPCRVAPGSEPRRRTMPELFETMQTMRAMRRLKPDPVPDELIRKILAAGVFAPNGANLQTWRFLVVKDEAIKRQVEVYYKRAVDEGMGPQERTAPPPPRLAEEAYPRPMAAVGEPTR